MNAIVHVTCCMRLKRKVIGSLPEYREMDYVERRSYSVREPPLGSIIGPRGTQSEPVREPPLGSILPPIREVDYVERRYALYESHLWDPLFRTLGMWTTWNAGNPCTRATSGIHISLLTADYTGQFTHGFMFMRYKGHV